MTKLQNQIQRYYTLEATNALSWSQLWKRSLERRTKHVKEQKFLDITRSLLGSANDTNE